MSLSKYSIDADTLAELIQKGVDSDVLRARIDYAEANQLLTHYIPALRSVRLHPRMLPTQASGRWSTTNPPLVNFPADCLNPDCPNREPHMAVGDDCWSLRDCAVPDVGDKWEYWDWDAIEARLVAVYCGDTEDLAAFNNNWDIHTLTMCGMYKLPKPQDLKNPHKSEIDTDWRGNLNWGGKDDRRRRLAKNCRYALAYGRDERAMDKYATEMKMSVAELRAAGKMYLDSKPALVAWKRRTWAECGRTKESRTFLGRRRRLMGASADAEKEGLNHKIQGSVADMMNWCLIQITNTWGECSLVYQSHDGAKIRFPRNTNPHPSIKEIVERVWEIEGKPMQFTATWGVSYAPEEEK
jgi:DNA polymerase I-like protein with 3'-5' exonuclease and polymerase domains